MSAPDWHRPLADLLGTPLRALNAESIDRWASDGLRENEQLDFKAELYGNGESQRRELAGDLAAFANHRGGLLILGVGEDEHGAASSVPGVELTDDEQRRIHQIVAGNVFPHLPIEIVPVIMRDDGQGVMVVLVAPSPLRPHAVAVNEGLRYPRRHGTVTRYLSESEVSDLYRNRFAIERDELLRVSELRRQAIVEIDQEGAVWISVAAAPTGAGSLVVSAQSIADTQSWAQQFVGNDLVSGFLGQAAPLVRPGLRRLRLLTHYAFNSRPNYQYAELHNDGAAVALHRLFTGRDAPVEGEPLPVLNMALLWKAASALNVVAAHALKVGAWGDVAVELTLFGPPRFLAWISHGQFIERIEGGRVLHEDLVAQRTLVLSDFAAGVQQLLAATRLLITDAFNAFGSPEVEALTSDGALNASHIGADPELQAWAERNHVAVE